MLSRANNLQLNVSTGWVKKLDQFYDLITFSSDELEMCLMCHFVANIVEKRLLTDHKLIFDAVVKHSLQMQQRHL